MNQSVIAKQSENFEVGAVLESSWGYEQTNWDFYVITKINNGWCTFQKIEKKVAYEGSEYMSSREKPVLGEYFVGPGMRRKIKKFSEPYVMVNSFASADLWDGREKLATHYA